MTSYRVVRTITIKRQPIRLSPTPGGDKFGHWWFEIGVDPKDEDSESYGWWPDGLETYAATLTGVNGILNGNVSCKEEFFDHVNQICKRDPHHGGSAPIVFNPLVLESDLRTDVQIADCLRQFAISYRGKWQWLFEGGQNCHTFQIDALHHCKLVEPEEHRSKLHQVKLARR